MGIVEIRRRDVTLPGNIDPLVPTTVAITPSTFGLAVHPRDPRVVFAGTDEGLYRSDDRGKNFEHIETPMDGLKVWRVSFDPVDPSIMFAGTAPPQVFTSTAPETDLSRGVTRSVASSSSCAGVRASEESVT